MFSSNIKILFSSLVLSSVIYSCSKKEEPSPSAVAEKSQVLFVNEAASDVIFQLNDKNLPDTFLYRLISTDKEAFTPYREVEYLSSGNNSLKAVNIRDGKVAFTQNINFAKATQQTVFTWRNPVEALGDPVTYGYLAVADTLTPPSNGKARFRFAIMKHYKTKDQTFDLNLVNYQNTAIDTIRVAKGLKIGQVSPFMEVTPQKYYPKAYLSGSARQENEYTSVDFEAGKTYTLVLTVNSAAYPYVYVVPHN